MPAFPTSDPYWPIAYFPASGHGVRWTLFSWLFLLHSATYGLQVIDTQDGMTHEVSISAKEPTRIRIEGAPITDVFGSVASSNCSDAAPAPSSPPGLPPQHPATAFPPTPPGELVLECDRDKGEIYVRPADGRLGEARKAIALFVASPHATYTLMLRRADVPADTILIRDRQAQAAAAAKAIPATTRARGNSAPIRAMRSLLLAMASPTPSPEFRMAEVGRRVAWWNEAELILLRRFEGRGLLGEQFQLRNTSAQTLVLSEQEFDREEGRVLGVAIEQLHVLPGQSTTVYLLRRGNTP